MQTLLVLLGLVTATAFGNSRQLVRGFEPNSNPYEVVFQSESKETDEAPGIYAIDSRGASRLLLPGNVIGANGRFSGVLAVLWSGHESERDEAIAILDGKLTLFTTKTKASDKKTYLEFGSDQHPVRDVLTRGLVRINPIESPQDVAIVKSELYDVQTRKYAELVLVSVKQKHALGSGFVFAVVLPVSNKRETKVETGGDIIAIAYDFLEKKALTKLIDPNDHHKLFVPSLLRNLATSKTSDPPLVTRWRKNVAKFAKFIQTETDKPPKEIAELAAVMPVYDVFQHNLALEEMPSAIVLEDPFFIRQHYDPLTGSAIVSTGLNAENGKAVGTQGMVDFDEEGNPLVEVYQNKVDGDSVALISRAGRYWAAIPIRNNVDSVEMIDLGIEATHNPIAFAHRFYDGNHYLVFSRAGMDGANTFCVVVEELGSRLAVVRQFDLMDRVLTARELDARLRLFTKDEDGFDEDDPDEEVELAEAISKGIYFDNVTPSKKGKRYDGKKNRTTPYLDLEHSLDAKPVQAYLRAIGHAPLATGVYHRTYDPEGAVESKTGLYVERGQEPIFLSGELLRINKRAVLDKEKMPKGDSHPGIDFHLMALASNPPSANSFRIVAVGQPEGAGVESGAFSFTVPASFESVRGAKIVLGRRRNVHELTILVFLDPSRKGTRQIDKLGGVFAQHFTVQFPIGQKRMVFLQRSEGAWLEKKAVAPTELKERLMPDFAGAWYWIVDPSVDTKSATFSVRALSNPKDRIFPRRAGFEKQMRWDESFTTDWTKFLGGSDWSIGSEYVLSNRHPEIGKIIDRAKKEGDEGGRDKNTALNKLLDSAAALNGPNQPIVLLVEDRQKDKFLEQIYLRLARNNKGPFSIRNWKTNNFYFHEPEPDCPPLRFSKELKKIAAGNTPKARGLVFTDIEQLLPEELLKDRKARLRRLGSEKGPQPAEEEGKLDEEEEEEEEEEEQVQEELAFGSEDGADYDEIDEDDEEEGRSKIKGSYFLLLATSGEDVPVTKVAATQPTVPVVLVATPEEWKLAQEIHAKEEAVFEKYKVVTEFLSAPWSIWPPKTTFASRKIKNYHRMPTSREEHQVLPDLEKLLLQAADPAEDPHHRVLIVSEEIKGLVERLVLSRWATDSKELEGPWNHKNRDLALFQFLRWDPGPKEGEKLKPTQASLLNNLETVRHVAKDRQAVVIGRLEEVLKMGRVSNAEGEHTIALRDPFAAAAGPDISQEVQEEAAEATESSRVPHALWWLMTEGENLSPRTASHGVAPTFDMLLIGSEKEWGNLQHETQWESRFGLHKQFEITRLEAPSEQRKLDLVNNLFNRPEVRRLGYTFELTGSKTTLDPQQQIISLIVNRASQIARQQHMDETAAFIRTYVELSRSLVQDNALRADGKIDRYFVENMFSRIFPVPIALNSLPKADFLHRLKDPVSAGMALQHLGYNSPLDLKIKYIETILSQTHGSTPGRPIPSSTILFGGTSTGKTYLFETMMRYLKLKSYDPDSSENEEAGYYIVKVRNLREKDDSGSPDLRGVDAELQNVADFLGGPNGHRAFLLFDDLHAAKSTEILRKIMAFIESLYEAKDGYITVKRKSGEVREVPIRNINLNITVNPQRDKELLDRYATDDQLVSQILAALAREDYAVEDSFLARFSTLLDMHEFPSEAKTPTLVRELRTAMEEDYRAHPSLVMIAPELLSRVVEGNREANAREFLSTATRGLIHVGSSVPEAPLYLATATPVAERGFRWNYGGSRTDAIESFVKANRVLEPVGRKDYGAQMGWLRMVMDSFRLQVVQTLLAGARRDPRLIADNTAKNGILVPLYLASTSYFSSKKHLPLSLVKVDPGDLGALEEDERDFVLRLMESASKDEKDFFPIDFSPSQVGGLPGLSEFLIQHPKENKQLNRRDVLSRVSRSVYQVITPLVGAYFRTPDLSGLEKPDAWHHGLPKEDPKELIIKVGDELTKLFVEFGGMLFDPNLYEMMHPQGATFTSFEHAHLFLMALDRAIVDFPWARLVYNLRERLSEAAQDLSLGQREEFQRYLFRHQLSPFNPITVDTVASQIDSLNVRPEDADAPSFQTTEGRCAALIYGGGK